VGHSEEEAERTGRKKSVRADDAAFLLDSNSFFSTFKFSGTDQRQIARRVVAPGNTE